MNLLIILGVLAMALFVLVPLIEKSNMRMSGESIAKLSKWFIPLMLVIAIAGLIKTL